MFPDLSHQTKGEIVDRRFSLRGLGRLAENFPSKATTAKLASNGLARDRFVQRNLRSAPDFGFRGSERRRAGGTAEIAFGAGDGETLRNRHDRRRPRDAATARGRVPRWFFSETKVGSDETDYAKGFGVPSIAAAGAGGYQSGVPEPR